MTQVGRGTPAKLDHCLTESGQCGAVTGIPAVKEFFVAHVSLLPKNGHGFP